MGTPMGMDTRSPKHGFARVRGEHYRSPFLLSAIPRTGVRYRICDGIAREKDRPSSGRHNRVYCCSQPACLPRDVTRCASKRGEGRNDPGRCFFLPPSSVALLCDEVFLDQESGAEKKPGHIDLGRWSDMFVVLPASADVLGQAANGLAPNLLTTTVLASPTPVVFYPSMNAIMWNKRAVQRNVESLQQDGHIVVQPELTMGHEIASGETREGWAVPEPHRVVEALREIYERPEFSARTEAASMDKP